jgi:hypothetical protein
MRWVLVVLQKCIPESGQQGYWSEGVFLFIAEKRNGCDVFPAGHPLKTYRAAYNQMGRFLDAPGAAEL